jgi:hypothetical protein
MSSSVVLSWLTDRQSHLAPAPGNAPRGAPHLADRGRRQAHWLDERHQDLIHDLGEQLIGRR